MKEDENEDKPELPENTTDILIEGEIKDQEVLIERENITQETSIVIEEKDNIIKNEINHQEFINNDVNNTVEIENNDQEVSTCTENKLEDISKENQNHQVESIKETDINNFELTNNNKSTAECETAIENSPNVLDLTEINENGVSKQLNEIKKDDLAPIVENNKNNLNISEELKVLDDAAQNSISLENSTTEKCLLVNGETSPLNCDESKHDFDDKIENHVVPLDGDKETKNIEIQNSLNTLLSEELKLNTVEKKNNDNTPLIIDSEDSNELATKEKMNGNVVNQDSISNSSDSETIVNSECLQIEINGDCIENSEHKAVAQPISVITIQTSDTVDSDCSEAYLTPNELNDTPKKKLEKVNMNANDYINIVDDDTMSQLNPSIEPNEVVNPSKIASDLIIEQKTNEDSRDSVENNIKIVEENVDDTEENIDEIKINVDKVEENVGETIENVNKSEENIIEVKESDDNLKRNKTIENCKETTVESTNDVNIVLQPHNELENVDGMFYL